MKETINSDLQLEGNTLILQKNSEEDFPYIFSATRHKGFNDGMPWSPPTDLEELKAPLEKALNAWRKGSAYSLTIKTKTNKIFLGRISIRKKEGNNHWNIGFWTHPLQQGNGVMTEAVAVILKFGFEVLLAEKITAEYATWNKASERVLQKNGFKFVEYIEKGFKKNKKWVAENGMEIQKSQWDREMN